MSELRHVSGYAQLAERMRALAPNIRKRILGGAVRKSALVIRNEAKARAPVWTGPVSQGHPPPGTLKREIIYKRLSEQCTTLREVYAVLVRRTKQRAFYWFFVEFGTRFMAAHPYLRPAFEAKSQEAIDAMGDELRSKLPEVAR